MKKMYIYGGVAIVVIVIAYMWWKKTQAGTTMNVAIAKP